MGACLLSHMGTKRDGAKLCGWQARTERLAKQLMRVCLNSLAIRVTASKRPQPNPKRLLTRGGALLATEWGQHKGQPSQSGTSASETGLPAFSKAYIVSANRFKYWSAALWSSESCQAAKRHFADCTRACAENRPSSHSISNKES